MKNSNYVHILMVYDSDGERKYRLQNPIYAIGRDPRCDIPLKSLSLISRRHATLVAISNEDGSHFYRVIDGVPKGKRSQNGIWLGRVNGRKIDAHNLQHEDLIYFGGDTYAIYYYQRDDDDDCAGVGNSNPPNLPDEVWRSLEQHLGDPSP